MTGAFTLLPGNIVTASATTITVSTTNGLQNAIATAAKGDIIQLNADIDLNNVTIDVSLGADLTLDLNGHAVRSAANTPYSDTAFGVPGIASTYSFVISNSSALTIVDSSVGGTITGTGNAPNALFYVTCGTLDLRAGTYSSTSSAIVDVQGAPFAADAPYSTVTVEGTAELDAADYGIGIWPATRPKAGPAYDTFVNIDGTIDAPVAISVPNDVQVPSDNALENEPAITINSSAVINGALLGAGYANWDIEGGIISAGNNVSAMELSAGTLIMDGGELTANGQPASFDSASITDQVTNGYGLAIVGRCGFAGNISVDLWNGELSAASPSVAIGYLTGTGPANPDTCTLAENPTGLYVPAISIDPDNVAITGVLTSDNPSVAPIYHVTLDANSGIVPAGDQFVFGNNLVSYPSSIPAKGGYTFTGWYVDAAASIPFDFTLPVDNPSNAPPDGLNANVTLYAGWQVVSTFTYDANGGQLPVPSTEIVYLGDSPSLPVPQLFGYEFAGWLNAATGKLWSPSVTVTSATGDVTLIAQWTPSRLPWGGTRAPRP